MVTDTASARVVRGLADAGVFNAGGVLVGTHAYIALGNLLGVRWESALKTQDIDIAAVPQLDIALPELDADVPSALESLEMGFLPVPGFDPASPTTSFKVRGQSLRVDSLTPSARTRTRPVVIRRLGAAARALRFLDYASERPAATQAKRLKDLTQAAELIEVLAEDRPGDLTLAWEALVVRGPSADSPVTHSRGLPPSGRGRPTDALTRTPTTQLASEDPLAPGGREPHRVLLGWIEEPIVPGAFGRAANAADRTRLVIDDDLVVHKQRRSGGVDREFHQ